MPKSSVARERHFSPLMPRAAMAGDHQFHGVASLAAFAQPESVEVQFPPELERKLRELAGQASRPIHELVQDMVASHVEELASLRQTLDSRYDDLKSGRVKPIDG